MVFHISDILGRSTRLRPLDVTTIGLNALASLVHLFYLAVHYSYLPLVNQHHFPLDYNLGCSVL